MWLIYFWLLLFLLIPAGITFAVPARYFGFWVAWVMMFAIGGAALPSGTDHSSPLSGIGGPVGGFVFISVAVAIGLKFAYMASRDRPTTAPHQYVLLVLFGVTGAFAGALGVTALPLFAAAARPAWFAHAVAIAVIFVGFALLVWPWGISRKVRLSFALPFVIAAAVGSALVGVRISSGIAAVAASAEEFAGERPYCIQVVGGRPGFDEFEPATTRLDLSPLTMRTACREGWCWQNHAVLVIDQQNTQTLKNWSYKFKQFRDEVLNVRTHPPAVVCQPRAHFARDLPWL